MKRLFTILLSTLMLFLIGCSSSTPTLSNTENLKPLSTEEKLEDFEYMYKILEENYPYFEVNKRMNNLDWLSKRDDYISMIKNTTGDIDFFNTLEKVLSDLNNGHTDMISKERFSRLKALYEQDRKSNKAWVKKLNEHKALQRYAFNSNDKNSDLSSSNKDKITKDNINTKIFEEGKAAYLSIKSLNSFNIENDFKIILPFLKEIKDYKGLIIDIRGNGGGDTRYWTDNLVPALINEPLSSSNYTVYRGGNLTEEFVQCRWNGGYKNFNSISDIDKEKLTNLPKELKEDFKYYSADTINISPKNPIDFKGKIYLLVDKYVFSSSEAFASFAKNTKFATLIGEKTGGDGIGSDPAIAVLPNSGYIFRFPKEMGLAADGSCNFECRTDPDIIIDATKTLDLKDDNSIQKAIELIN
ncbi:S41 family peptidase [Clostridium sp. ZBS15]|uniref:S41 family peptidase n=1 Tax=Clostridium sp. ZBS15 TaxID=2949969 RepID=UPI00207975DA|nr:S41 family peptidase [Clostridium sp. ZBS15]